MMMAILGAHVLMSVLAAEPVRLSSAESIEPEVRAKADAAITRGIEYLKKERFEEALREFISAYYLSPTPRGIAQMGLAHQGLEHYAEAEARLMEALAAKDDPWIRTRRPALEAALKDIQSHLGSLDVQGLPIGAEIRIDDDLVGALPLAHPLRLKVGKVRVDLSAQGFTRVVRYFDIQAGKTESCWIELAHLAPPPVAQAPAPAPPAPPMVSSTAAPHAEDSPSALGVVSWSSTILGAALGAAGAITWAATGHRDLGPGLVAAGTGAVLAGGLGFYLDSSSTEPSPHPATHARAALLFTF
jgi:hypothetical protein